MVVMGVVGRPRGIARMAVEVVGQAARVTAIFKPHQLARTTILGLVEHVEMVVLVRGVSPPMTQSLISPIFLVMLIQV